MSRPLNASDRNTLAALIQTSKDLRDRLDRVNAAITRVSMVSVADGNLRCKHGVTTGEWIEGNIDDEDHCEEELNEEDDEECEPKRKRGRKPKCVESAQDEDYVKTQLTNTVKNLEAEITKLQNGKSVITKAPLWVKGLAMFGAERDNPNYTATLQVFGNKDTDDSGNETPPFLTKVMMYNLKNQHTKRWDGNKGYKKLFNATDNNGIQLRREIREQFANQLNDLWDIVFPEEQNDNE